MCGIVGVLNLINPAPIDGERLQRGNDAMLTRGPDDAGVWVQPDIGLAMRRLSIIDVAHGHQPMANEDGTVHIVYNGECYNHKDLRRELEAAGHVFRTNADTEAVLHGYEEWGREGLLERMRGMFAFAIWDAPDQSLFLARDRMGIKPLYFAEHDGRFYFSSAIRPILIASDMPRQVNAAALDVFMQIGFVTTPHTIFEGIQKMPPAHYLWIKDGRVTRRQYWALSYESTHSRPEAQIVEEFRSRLMECIDSHLMSDVALGALLSGGVDSTTNAAFMTRLIDEPFKTVTLGFEDDRVDEAMWAEASAREMGTDHHTAIFAGDGMDAYPFVSYYNEEPVGATQASLYHIFKACREQGLTVVMTGEGADELLGGYRWHQASAMDRALSHLPFWMQKMLEINQPLGRLGHMGRNIVRRARGVPTTVHERYSAMMRGSRHPHYDGVLVPDVAAAAGVHSQAIFDEWAAWLSGVRNRPEFDQLLWLQSRTRMVDFINHGLDRMSMAHSIEARPPFLDHTLWEFCASIPTGFKMRHSTEKYLLRQAGAGIVPEAARIRKKKPLTAPYGRWMRRERLPDWAETVLSERALTQAGFFDPLAIKELRRRICDGDMSRTRTLMSVISMQTWAHWFLHSSLAAEPKSL